MEGSLLCVGQDTGGVIHIHKIPIWVIPHLPSAPAPPLAPPANPFMLPFKALLQTCLESPASVHPASTELHGSPAAPPVICTVQMLLLLLLGHTCPALGACLGCALLLGCTSAIAAGGNALGFLETGNH